MSNKAGANKLFNVQVLTIRDNEKKPCKWGAIEAFAGFNFIMNASERINISLKGLDSSKLVKV